MNPCQKAIPLFMSLVLSFAILLFGTMPCTAQEGGVTSANTTTAEKRTWEFDLSASYYSFRSQDDFTLAVARADSGPPVTAQRARDLVPGQQPGLGEGSPPHGAPS